MKYKFRVIETNIGTFRAEYKKGMFGGWQSCYMVGNIEFGVPRIYATIEEALSDIKRYKARLEEDILNGKSKEA